MVIFSWSGKGFLVLVFTLGFSLLANLATNFITGNRAYWETHKWPLGLSLFASATACWFVGRILQNEQPQVLIDAKTGNRLLLRKSHTMWYIPVIWWSPILAAGGALALFLEFTK